MSRRLVLIALSGLLKAALLPSANATACPIAGGCVMPVGQPHEIPTPKLPNANGYMISAGFFTTANYDHAGIDLANGSDGGEVRAIATGTVVETRASLNGFGHSVRIRHILADGRFLYSIYGHMSSNGLLVFEGQEVAKGQLLGYVDTTGLATGSHLHFALRTVDDYGCGYVPSRLAQCANDRKSNYIEPLKFLTTSVLYSQTNRNLAELPFYPSAGQRVGQDLGFGLTGTLTDFEIYLIDPPVGTIPWVLGRTACWGCPAEVLAYPTVQVQSDRASGVYDFVLPRPITLDPNWLYFLNSPDNTLGPIPFTGSISFACDISPAGQTPPLLGHTFGISSCGPYPNDHAVPYMYFVVNGYPP